MSRSVLVMVLSLGAVAPACDDEEDCAADCEQYSEAADEAVVTCPLTLEVCEGEYATFEPCSPTTEHEQCKWWRVYHACMEDCGETPEQDEDE